MTIDKKSINKKLKRLTEALGYLEKYKKEAKEDFLIDFTVNAAAMHYMVLGIEIITDIGNHILNENYQVSSDEYSEVIEKLGEYEIVPEKFAEENADMAKFRNLIIHAYDKIDMGQVYQNLQKTPDIFRKFAKYYVDFLEKH